MPERIKNYYQEVGLMHSSFKSSCRRVLWLLPLALLLSFSQSVPGAWAQAGIYSGPVKFTVTSTVVNDKGSFHSEHTKITGTAEFYLGGPEDGDSFPVTYEDQMGNYYLRVYDDANHLMIGIDKMAAIKSEPKHAYSSSSIKGLATGTYFHQEGGEPVYIEGIPVTGPVNMNINSGTMVKNHDGSIKKINLSLKFSGGVMDNVNPYNVVWSGTLPVSLTYNQQVPIVPVVPVD
jgi:hypothetical protein